MSCQLGAGVWPVVQRELRQAARWRGGRWLRMGGALGGVIIFYGVSFNVLESAVGLELFGKVHTLLLCLICAIVPALTADCIARERREGTLGLLFLTPLSASGIVLGKILAQVLRGLTVWLAVAPVLTFAFLTGGVTWQDVVSYLAIEICAGMVCLAAGILASSLAKSRGIAFVLAFFFLGFLLMGVLLVNIQVLADAFFTSISMAIAGGSQTSGVVTTVVTGVTQTPTVITTAITGGSPTPMSLTLTSALATFQNLLIAAAILLASLILAGWCVERSWRDKPRSIRRQKWVRRFCTPIFNQWFARRMRRTLEWNPMAWLQQYSWQARLSKWGLCFLFVVLECAVIDGKQYRDIAPTLMGLFVILAAAYTFAGVNGFLQAKRNGALELILVTPLSIKQIIFGRVWGLWNQFLPSLLVLLASDVAAHGLFTGTYVHFESQRLDWSLFCMKDLEIVTLYLTLPVFATFCALSYKNLFVAAAMTWAAVLLPVAFGLMSGLPFGAPLLVGFIMAAGNMVMGLFALDLLRSGLARRSHPFS